MRIAHRNLEIPGSSLRDARNDGLNSPAPPVAGILHHVAVVALLPDVLLFVVAMALGGVERDFWRAAGTLVALVVVGDGGDGFGHSSSP